MSEQDDGKVSTVQRPNTNDPEAWKAYWKAKGWSWRTEPEIDAERQKYLDERRKITPNIKKGIYPFKDIEPKLTRADIEWLLVTHENGRGPVNWNDESQRERQGLDLRGADLRHANLQNLPLACLQGGLTYDEMRSAAASAEFGQIEAATIHLERAYLKNVHLEYARLNVAYLDEAILSYAHMNGAECNTTNFRKADFRLASLEDVDFGWCHLEEANFYKTHLERANLQGAYLERANFVRAYLGGANLAQASFDLRTNLYSVALGDKKTGFICLVDAAWSGVNLALVKWSEIDMLGDEYKALQKNHEGKVKDKKTRLYEHEQAIRANRQLSVVLQSQGLNEDASRFAYRAQKLQRTVLRRQKKYGQYLFSLFLDLLAGYGYRPGRSVLWYLATILVFAISYHFLGGLTLYPPDAFVFSIMSFHGRGFFPALSQETNLHNPLVMLAALEAIIGLLIEISFIATFTQRFFGK